MNELRLSISPIRPLPYYHTASSAEEKRLAAALRREFVPKVKRLLPGHHLGGFRHDTVVNFIKRHKRAYPCFVRTDIARFYPSIRHRDIVVGCQVAYRDLLGLEYVPGSFKKKYVGGLNRWCIALPLERGIPLGSALSAIVAPVMLLPLWLEIKRRFKLPLLVFADDILVCTRDESQSADIYTFMAGYLHRHYNLETSARKTVSGRFASDAVEICGWRFAGGYSTVSQAKVQAFMDRITAITRRRGKTDRASFFKVLNRKIDGFGHYYKYGDVKGQFRRLDMFIRQEVRARFERTGGPKLYSRDRLNAAGLHSLELIAERVRQEKAATARKISVQPSLAGMQNAMQRERTASELQPIAETLEKLRQQFTQLLAVERKQLRLMQEILQV